MMSCGGKSVPQEGGRAHAARPHPATSAHGRRGARAVQCEDGEQDGTDGLMPGSPSAGMAPACGRLRRRQIGVVAVDVGVVAAEHRHRAPAFRSRSTTAARRSASRTRRAGPPPPVERLPCRRSLRQPYRKTRRRGQPHRRGRLSRAGARPSPAAALGACARMRAASCARRLRRRRAVEQRVERRGRVAARARLSRSIQQRHARLRARHRASAPGRRRTRRERREAVEGHVVGRLVSLRGARRRPAAGGRARCGALARAATRPLPR